jgi:hypothetical protein
MSFTVLWFCGMGTMLSFEIVTVKFSLQSHRQVIRVLSSKQSQGRAIQSSSIVGCGIGITNLHKS